MNDYPKKHPTGLWVLFTTEMWERFAFYAMRAILVLYLVDVSTNEQTPGFGWSEADAYRLYGVYTCLVYFLPLVGGWIADRFLGQRRCVVLGGGLMALGEFFLAATEFIRIGGGVKITMATDPTALAMFYVGLGLMIVGNGFFKPCISVMVGQLYAPGDIKRDSAFSIFYMGINIGAFLSPLVAGTVAEKYGYHLGFLIAGFGMIFGLITFMVFGSFYLKGIGMAPVKHDPDVKLGPEEKAILEKAQYEQTRPIGKQDWDRMFVIIILSLFVIAFWVSFEQAGSSLNVFAKNQTDRSIAESIVEKTPKIILEDLYLNNEDVVEFESAVNRGRALEEQLHKAGETVVREPWGKRTAKLFAFQVKKDDRPLEVQVTELKAIAVGLFERLQKSEDPDIQAALDALDKAVQEDDGEVAGELLEALRVVVGPGSPEAEEVHALNISAFNDEITGTRLRERVEEILEKSKLTLPEDAERDKKLGQLAKRKENITGAINALLAFEQGENGKDIQAALEDIYQKRLRVDRHFVPGQTLYTFPTTWYQSVNALGIVVFVPIFTAIWLFLAARGIEPSTPMKFAIGLLLLSVGFFLMIPGAVEAKLSHGKAGPHWLIWCYLFSTWGELYLSPVGLSMVTKLAPARYASFFMGVWFMASSIAYLLAGELARMFGSGEGVHFFFGKEKGLADFFLLMGLIPFIIGVIALLLAPKLKRMMHGIN